MKFRKLLYKDVDKEDILLGKNDEHKLKVNINNYPSIVISGSTGTGKSILLDQIILQLITKYTSEELRLLLIDTSGVELNYYTKTNHILQSSMNNKDKGVIILAKVLEEIDRRNSILIDNDVSSIDEFNNKFNHKIPKLLVAIDDNDGFLKEKDVINMITKIINSINNLSILFILVTNDVHNKFFIDDKNLDASINISYDHASIDESNNVNIPYSSELEIGRFIAFKDNKYEEFKNFKFDDEIIQEIID